MPRKFTIWTGTQFKEMTTAELPKKKGFKYLLGVRHLRYFYHSYRLSRHIRRCIRAGLGLFPQESDLMHLQMIWEGKA